MKVQGGGGRGRVGRQVARGGGRRGVKHGGKIGEKVHYI